MKIYLDNCCYNRPFDDQGRERIHLESEAVLSILKKCQTGEYELVGSNLIDYEFNRMADEEKKRLVKGLFEVCHTKIVYSDEIKNRAKEIQRISNIKVIDSAHIAAAEEIKADVLLTTDDRLEKMASRLDLKVRVMNPLRFILEEVFNG